MKIGYRDTQHAGAHRVRLGGVLVTFDAKGIAWDPLPAARAALTANPLRSQRFVEVREEAPKPAVPPSKES